MSKRLIFALISLVALFSLVFVFVDDFKIIGFAIKTNDCLVAKDTFVELSKSYSCTTQGTVTSCYGNNKFMSYEKGDLFERWVVEGKTYKYSGNGVCEVS